MNRRGFALGSRIRGDDDFFDRPAFEALDEGLYPQLLWPAPGQRREGTAKHVIHTAVSARFFNGHDVVRFFDYADHLFVAIRARAEVTRVIFGNVAADRALADFFFGVANGFRESQGVFRRGAQKKEDRKSTRLISSH